MRHKRPPNSWQRVTPRATDRAGTWVLFIYYAEYLLCRDDVKPLADRYRAAGERAGHADSLKLALSTHFHAGADPQAARATYPYYHEYLRPKAPGGRGFTVSRAAFEAGTGPGGAIMIGSAAEVTGKLLAAKEALGLDRIFAQVDWGGLPAGLVEESIARYATEIAPEIRSA